MTEPNAQDPTPEQVSGTPPRPGPPKPGAPRPGVAKPTPTGSEHAPKPHPVSGQTHPHAPAVPASDPSKFGRVDEDGTAWVRTADGERCIGSWQAGNAAEGLEHFGRRYDDLATEVALLETRLTSGSGDAKKTRVAAEALLESLPTAAVIGDLDTLATRLTGVIEESDKAAVAQKQEKEQHRAEPPPARKRSRRRPRRSARSRHIGRPQATACGRSSTSGSRSAVSTVRPTTRCGAAIRRRERHSTVAAAPTSPNSIVNAPPLGP